jgi:hypothetical protein
MAFVSVALLGSAAADDSKSRDDYILYAHWEDVPADMADSYLPGSVEDLETALVGWFSQNPVATLHLSGSARMVRAKDPFTGLLHANAYVVVNFSDPMAGGTSLKLSAATTTTAVRAGRIQAGRGTRKARASEEEPELEVRSTDPVVRFFYKDHLIAGLADSLFQVDWSRPSYSGRRLSEYRGAVSNQETQHPVVANHEAEAVVSANGPRAASTVDRRPELRGRFHRENARPGDTKLATMPQGARMYLTLEPNIKVKNTGAAGTVKPGDKGVKPDPMYLSERVSVKPTETGPGRLTRLDPDNNNRLDQDSDFDESSANWNLQEVWGAESLPMPYSAVSTSIGYSQAWLYVIDVGMDVSHPEFSPNRASVIFDWYNGQFPIACNAHATHVAGIAAGNTVGVFPTSTIFNLRALDCNGDGSLDAVLAAIQAATTHCTNAGGARTRSVVVNLSLSGSGDPTQGTGLALSQAMATMRTVCDASFAVAAGNNNGDDACDYVPASQQLTSQGRVTTVGATAENFDVASFSNLGGCVNVFAPGVNVVSALPGGLYGPMWGTSMAAPHVAGVYLAFAAVIRYGEGWNVSQSGLFAAESFSYALDIAQPVVYGQGPGTTDLFVQLIPDSPYLNSPDFVDSEATGRDIELVVTIAIAVAVTAFIILA